jgi:Ca-activated chloride channel family protein
LKAATISEGRRPSANLVFLLDVSGSMDSPEKLPLLRQAMRLLVGKLEEGDRVAIVVYAGASGVVLPSTSAAQKEAILEALDSLEAGGATNGGAGIQTAYEVASANFIKNGVNRVVLATDGDFNVGITNQGDLVRLIKERARQGVFLSVLGFGMDNYKDSALEKLADHGNGNYAYIDTLREAQRVLVEQVGGTLVTVAKDVKIQVEFNPVLVAAYRLLGYENRRLAHQDFNDDAKDAGEMGAGQTVTALYELVPVGVDIDLPSVAPLKYQSRQPGQASRSEELLTVKVRYKEPQEDRSRVLEFPLIDRPQVFDQASEDFRFAAAVAAFGMLLRESPHRGSASFDSVLEIAQSSLDKDPLGYRKEFVELVQRAREAGGEAR